MKIILNSKAMPQKQFQAFLILNAACAFPPVNLNGDVWYSYRVGWVPARLFTGRVRRPNLPVLTVG